MIEIKSLQNALVKHWTKLRQNRDYRYDHLSLIVEGKKMVEEALAFLEPIAVVFSDPAKIPANYQGPSEKLYQVTQPIMEKISGLKTPEGLLAEFKMPGNQPFKAAENLLVLDGVNDPGNIGTLLRSALAFGWKDVFFLENSCDPFNEKSLRAARGAIFHLNIHYGNWEDLKDLIRTYHFTPIVAELKGTPFEQMKKGKYLLVLGNEGQGPSERSLQECQKIHIPTSPNVESLNVAVAGSILMQALSGYQNE